MPMSGILSQMLMSVGTQIPVLLTCIAGFFLAMAFWQRDSRAALLVVLACLLGLFEVLAFGVIYAILPGLIRNATQGSPFAFQWIFMGLGLLRGTLTAVTWILMLTAVFRRRSVA